MSLNLESLQRLEPQNKHFILNQEKNRLHAEVNVLCYYNVLILGNMQHRVDQ